MKAKVLISLTADDVRKLLGPRLGEIFDSLVKNMVGLGVDEEDAKEVVAQHFWEWIVYNAKHR